MKRALRFAPVVLVCCFIIVPSRLLAEEIGTVDAGELLKELRADDGFVYVREGRPDPFVPFMTDRSKVLKPALTEEELVGMRKFEPGQLSLVAVVLSGKANVAMVQDPAGQGYVIRQGTKIGRSGVVENIVPNRVIIKSVSYNRAGDEIVNRVEMLLKKEGEEK
jgi:type IV pilus assembly protein PilP